MVAAGDYLIVLATEGGRSGRRQEVETFIFLVEPKTGKVRLTWRQP
jgi:hypothetical protein